MSVRSYPLHGTPDSWQSLVTSCWEEFAVWVSLRDRTSRSRATHHRRARSRVARACSLRLVGNEVFEAFEWFAQKTGDVGIVVPHGSIPSVTHFVDAGATGQEQPAGGQGPRASSAAEAPAAEPPAAEPPASPMASSAAEAPEAEGPEPHPPPSESSVHWGGSEASEAEAEEFSAAAENMPEDPEVVSAQKAAWAEEEGASFRASGGSAPAAEPAGGSAPAPGPAGDVAPAPGPGGSAPAAGPGGSAPAPEPAGGSAPPRPGREHAAAPMPPWPADPAQREALMATLLRPMPGENPIARIMREALAAIGKLAEGGADLQKTAEFCLLAALRRSSEVVQGHCHVKYITVNMGRLWQLRISLVLNLLTLWPLWGPHCDQDRNTVEDPEPRSMSGAPCVLMFDALTASGTPPIDS
ncbi:MAG: hypothetical protein GY772_31635 [bacterium]|nr:hypothetical protein [bacterium]